MRLFGPQHGAQRYRGRALAAIAAAEREAGAGMPGRTGQRRDAGSGDRGRIGRHDPERALQFNTQHRKHSVRYPRGQIDHQRIAVATPGQRRRGVIAIDVDPARIIGEAFDDELAAAPVAHEQIERLVVHQRAAPGLRRQPAGPRGHREIAVAMQPLADAAQDVGLERHD